jgi:hypothetical protein
MWHRAWLNPYGHRFVVLVIAIFSALLIVFVPMLLVNAAGLDPNAAQVPLIRLLKIVFPSEAAGRRMAVWLFLMSFPETDALVSPR